MIMDESQTLDILIKLLCVGLAGMLTLLSALTMFLTKKILDSDKKLAVIETVVNELKAGREAFYNEIRYLARSERNG